MTHGDVFKKVLIRKCGKDVYSYESKGKGLACWY